jgi:hypothetical protein
VSLQQAQCKLERSAEISFISELLRIWRIFVIREPRWYHGLIPVLETVKAGFFMEIKAKI